MRNRFLLAMFPLVIIGMGCESSTPTRAEEDPVPRTADAAVEDFGNALVGLDGKAMQRVLASDFLFHAGRNFEEIGRASCRERV